MCKLKILSKRQLTILLAEVHAYGVNDPTRPFEEVLTELEVDNLDLRYFKRRYRK